MSTYAIPGISSNAARREYGHNTAGGSGSVRSGGDFFAGPRLSFDMSDGSEVKSVLGVSVPAPEKNAERASADDEVVSVKGEGGVVI